VRDDSIQFVNHVVLFRRFERPAFHADSIGPLGKKGSSIAASGPPNSATRADMLSLLLGSGTRKQLNATWSKCPSTNLRHHQSSGILDILRQLIK
jgi:hypothetical protein